MYIAGMELHEKNRTNEDQNPQRRVVVTGVGLVSPLAVGTDAVWHSILRSKSGVRRIETFDPSPFRCQIAGEAQAFDPLEYIERKELKKMARFIQFAIAAAELAMAHAAIRISPNKASRTGVCIGSALGGLDVIERERRNYVAYGLRRVSPFLIPASTINSASGFVSVRLGAKGPLSAVATGGASGTYAVGESFRMIQRGDADMMLCGGAEACINPLGLGGFDAMGVLSRRNSEPERASRPWDRDRDGFVLGEGAGILVLEEMECARRRGAVVLAEVIGFGMSGAASVRYSEIGGMQAMWHALRDAAILPEQVNHINAHGVSTRNDDLLETRAVKLCFGDHAYRLAMSSTKSMTGHLLGAAGAIDAGIAVLSLRHQTVPPTINYETLDPECDLDYVPNIPRPLEMDYVLSNSFGFGGANASLVFGRTTREHDFTNALRQSPVSCHGQALP